MRFDPEQLPHTVKEYYKMGKIAWHITICAAMKVGVINLNILTDIAFHIHHPERKGKPLEHHETELIAEWNNFKTLIKALDSSKTFRDDLDRFAFKKGEEWINLLNVSNNIVRPMRA